MALGSLQISEHSALIPAHIPTYDELIVFDKDRLSFYVNNLKEQADRHWSIDPNISLQYASLIEHIGHALNRPDYVALGLMAQGDAVKNIGYIKEAWDLLWHAGLIFLDIGDKVGWARTRIGLTVISVEIDKVQLIMPEVEESRQILATANMPKKSIFLDMNVAIVHYHAGDIENAIRYYNECLATALTLDDHDTALLWPIYYNLALSYVEVGQLQKASHHYELAIESALGRNEIRNAVMAMTSLATLLQRQGKCRQALTFLYQAADLAGPELVWDKITIDSIIAECYLQLNRFREARDLMNKVIQKLTELGLSNNAARNLVHLAAAESNLQNYDEANQALDRADGFLEKGTQSVWRARQFLQRAHIAFKKQDFTVALHQADAAQAVSPSSVTAARAMTLKGKICLAQGKYARAQDHAHQALKIAYANHLDTVRYGIYLLLGRIAEAKHQVIHAVHCYQVAVAMITRSLSNLTMTLRADYLEDKQEAIHALLNLYINSGQVAEAFSTLEHAKSQVLLNYLNNQDSLHWFPSSGDSHSETCQEIVSLMSELNRLRGQHQWHYGLVYQNFAPFEEVKHAAPSSDSVVKLQQIERQIREVKERLYLLSENTFSRQADAIPTLSAAQTRLSADDLLVMYYSDGRSLWAFVIEKTATSLLKMPISSHDADRLIDKLHANLDWALSCAIDDPIKDRLTHKYKEIAHQLYQKLVSPFEHQLSAKQRLMIVPYGSLHYLPFNTLFTGLSYLIETHEVVIMPSSAFLTRQNTYENQGARIIAHTGTPQLSFVIEEAHTLQELLASKMVCECHTEENAQQSLFTKPPAKILHIAAHGEYRIDAPGFSYLQLSDGQVYLDDILQHDLRCDLVVLNGCETGRAMILAGDEIMGLGRSILYAGAATVIASLWRVDDESASRIVQYFYQYLINGASKAKALQCAQQSLLGERPDLHPTYWGALQLIGDPDTLSA